MNKLNKHEKNMLIFASKYPHSWHSLASDKLTQKTALALEAKKAIEIYRHPKTKVPVQFRFHA